VSSKLAPHWTPEHYDATRDVPVLRRWNPPVIKFMTPNGPPPQAALQDALDLGIPLIIIREWTMSEEKQVNSTDQAINRGINHADRCEAMMDGIVAQHGNVDVRRFAFEGWNEPWTVIPDWVNAYYRAFLLRLRQYELRGVALNYGVGWPADYGIRDSAVNWEPYEDVYKEIVAGEHLLGLHEYWWHESVKSTHPDGRGGQMGGWRWEAGRYLQCPWNVPILITECGIDEGVVPGRPNHGWRQFYGGDPRRYLDQLIEYDAEIRQDPRIVAATIFTHDTNDEVHWWTFDTRVDDFLSVFLPYVESQQGAIEGSPANGLPGFISDIVDDLPVHPAIRYDSRPLSAIKRLVIHHTATPRDTTTPQAIAAYHVNTNGWAGSAYHVVVTGDGHAWLVNRLTTVAAGASGFNHDSVHLAFTGNFTEDGGDTPSTAQMAAGRQILRWLLKLLDLTSTDVTGHKNLPGHDTQCPGDGLHEEWWRMLLADAEPVDPLNDPTWHSEEATREIESVLTLLAAQRESLEQQLALNREMEIALAATRKRLKDQVTVPLYRVRGIKPPGVA